MSILLLEASNIEKYFADVKILDIKDFRIYEGDRIGFVGPNGCGKTTLLNILSGEMAPDGGMIRRYCDVSYIRQFGPGNTDAAHSQNQCPKPTFSHTLSPSPPLPSSDLNLSQKLGQYGVLSKHENQNVSGGESTRIKLAHVLSAPGQLVFADEPTSSLDAGGIKQFSNELARLTSFILISHDRALLNRHCNRIITIEDCDISIYEGNYDAYKQQASAKHQRDLFEYQQYQSEKGRLQKAYADKKSKAAKVEKKPRNKSNSDAKMQAFATNKAPGGKARRLEQGAKAIQARIGQLDEKKRPRETPQIKLDFALTNPPRNKVVVSGEGISFAYNHAVYGQQVIFENAAFEVQNGARIALQGQNGSGKTTLLNLIWQGDKAIYTVPKLCIGYFRQGFEGIDLNKAVLQNAMADSVQTETTVRNILARLLFPSADMKKPAGVLSGGERVKLSLAKLLVSGCNMLLMDEPTNYLDMPSLEVLQAILREYEGTMMLVSHDSTFVDAVCTEMLTISDKALIQTKH